MAIAAALLAGCTPSGDASPSPTPPGSSASATTTAPPATTTPPTSSTEIPRVPQDYADEFVRAWGAGDTARAELLATSDVLTQLEGRQSGQWARVATEGAAGHTYVTYRENDTGEEFVLGVVNQYVDAGEQHAVDQVRDPATG